MTGSAPLSLLDPDPRRVREAEGARSVSFFCLEQPVHVDAALVDELEALSHARGDVNVRLCLHDGPEAPHHDMLILERAGARVQPHRHLDVGETWDVKRGVLAVCLFDARGALVRSLRLVPGDVFRMPPDTWHAVLPVTSRVVYHESKPGPFRRDRNEPAPWAPDGVDRGSLLAPLADRRT